jgi:hypothetical protein
LKSAAKFSGAIAGAALIALLPGCGNVVRPQAAGGPSAPVVKENPKQAARTKVDEERTEMEKIPAPLKSHYLSVATASAWQNPFVVVGTDSLKVIVMMGDPNPSPMGAGGLLRPSGARKDIEEIQPDKLGEMLSDLPANAWPYGRVVAIEESKQPERADRAAMRRNMESSLQTLSNLGIVANEWNEPASAR